MLLPAGGDVGIQPFLLTGFHDRSAAVAGIRNEGIWQLSGVGFDVLQHGLQVHRIAGLVAHPDAMITWWSPSTAAWAL